MQTEFHHLRTLKIMSDVYSRGMMADLLFEQQMVEKLFPCLDELISIHSQFFQRILERKKDSLVDKSEKNFLIKRIGDVLVQQVSRSRAPGTSLSYTRTHTDTRGDWQPCVLVPELPVISVSLGGWFHVSSPQFSLFEIEGSRFSLLTLFQNLKAMCIQSAQRTC